MRSCGRIVVILAMAAVLLADSLPADEQLRLGKEQLAAQNWAKAAELLRRAHTLRPGHTETLYYLAQSLYLGGDRQEGLRVMLKAAAGAPKHPEVAQKTGEYLCDAGRCAEGLPYLLKARQFDPQLDRIAFDIGAAYWQLKRASEAIPFLETALKADPANVAAAIDLGEALSTEQEWRRAKEVFGALADRDPRNAQALYGLGRALVALEEYERAVPVLRSALAAGPTLAKAHFQLGRALRELGQTAEAERELELFRTFRDHEADRASPLDRNQTATDRKRWQVLKENLAAGREAEALQNARGFSESDGRTANPYCVMGAAYTGLKRYEDAIRTLAKALAENPRDARCQAHSGWAFLGAGRVLEAQAAFAQALALDARNPLALLGLGKLYFERKNWREAIGYFERAKTTDVPALVSLCYAYLQTGERQNALKTAELVRALGARDAAALQAIERMFDSSADPSGKSRRQ